MGDLITPPAVAVDYDEIAKRVWERLIPAVPVSGAFEEKVKQMIMGYELVRATGSFSVAAGSLGVVNVQPAAGEYWIGAFAAQIATAVAGSEAFCCHWGGTTRYGGMTLMAGGEIWPKAALYTVIDNVLYAQIGTVNADTAAHLMFYSYYAIKIKSSSASIAKFTPTRRLLSEMNRVRHNPHSSITLPDYLKPLEKYAFISPEGEVAIYLEKDVPLRRDERGNIIERLTVYCRLKDFERLFGDLIADTTKRPLMTHIRARSVERKMGWEKYIDKWKAEGIEF